MTWSCGSRNRLGADGVVNSEGMRSAPGVNLTLYREQSLHSTYDSAKMTKEKLGDRKEIHRKWWGNRRKNSRSRRQTRLDYESAIGEMLVRMKREREGSE